jgi:hypothetical protein
LSEILLSNEFARQYSGHSPEFGVSDREVLVVLVLEMSNEEAEAEELVSH